MFHCAVACILTLLQVYGGIYPEDKHWYRCRVKELVDDDKVHVLSSSCLMQLLNCLSVTLIMF